MRRCGASPPPPVRVEIHALDRQLIADLVRGVVGRYVRLAEAGRIELSTTPYHHPLAPLLLDFQSAREADPLRHRLQHMGGDPLAPGHDGHCV